MNELIPVILCGGSGTRLWPLSRETQPKQFLALNGGALSLLQQTLQRLDFLPDPLPTAQPPLLVANHEHRFLVAAQVHATKRHLSGLLLEPVGRNTAPALTLAALQATHNPAQGATSNKNPVLMVMPADHVLQDLTQFHTALAQAWPLALAGGIVTFGIVPHRPETGYGYIHRGSATGEGSFTVKNFLEKPNLPNAQALIAGGQHLWNSGMFMLQAQTWLDAINMFRPDIMHACQQAMTFSTRDLDFVRPDINAFTDCPSDSIDYAVLERIPTTPTCKIPLHVMTLNAGWSDVGAWDAVWGIMPHDQHNNATMGDVLLHNTQNSLLYASTRTVAGVGLDHMVVVETPDAVLVADQRQVQDVKHIVAQLKAGGHSLAKTHRKIHRPWGWYDAVDHGSRFQVKHIVVNPGASLSLQMHYHRAEHWIVVRGTAEVTNGDKTFLLGENESTFIPLGHTHRLSNPGKIPLEIIEVQSGDYLGEDDIVRLEDSYGRSTDR
ncbi:MAG: mannose-1-phosphate guanylyltransferase/mannose-6-phosphate isomerase [Macromonas sp.]